MAEFIDISENQKEDYNASISHPLQSFEWGEFRKKTGIKVVRRALLKNNKIIDGFTLTIHKIPKVPYTVGYLPKGNTPSEEILAELKRIGQVEKCIFIQLEPNVILKQEAGSINLEVEKYFKDLIHNPQFLIQPSFHPLFTKYTFFLDISKNEEELLKNMHSKTRYNIRVAQKNNVKVTIDDSEKSFEEYLRLTHETTTRQKFYAHTKSYHKKQWETLSHSLDTQHIERREILNEDERHSLNNLSSHLLTATYGGKTLVSWILFIFKDTLYYPYGASSSEHRNVMASNLVMWEAIKFGKSLGLKKFDMWGALGPEHDPKDPWIGFHKFKQGYGAQLTEFVGSYDLIIDPMMYQLYKVGDKLRWLYLKVKK